MTHFTDVLEWISLLSCVSASLHFPQSRKHKVSVSTVRYALILFWAVLVLEGCNPACLTYFSTPNTPDSAKELPLLSSTKVCSSPVHSNQMCWIRETSQTCPLWPWKTRTHPPRSNLQTSKVVFHSRMITEKPKAVTRWSGVFLNWASGEVLNINCCRKLCLTVLMS